MILATAAGWAVQHFAGVTNALIYGLLLGLVVAPLIPSRAGCPIGRRSEAS